MVKYLLEIKCISRKSKIIKRELFNEHIQIDCSENIDESLIIKFCYPNTMRSLVLGNENIAEK